MGLLSSIESALGGFFNGVASAVNSFASSIGGSLGAMCKALCPAIGIVLAVLGALVEKVAKLLGIVQPEDKPEELGLKAEVSGKKPENYDSYCAYIEDIKNTELTHEDKLKLETKEGKAKYIVIGTGIMMEGISEKSGLDIPLGFWIGAGKSGLTAQEIKSVLENLKDMDKVADLEKYFSGKLTIDGMEQGDYVLEKSFKDINPEITDKELDSKFDKLKEEFENFKI